MRLFWLLSALTLSAQTYSRDVAPIIYQHCSNCHRPGEAGPFSLLNYEDVRSHAKQVIAVTKSRYMPPWKADGMPGEFEGDARLSDSQIRTLQQWLGNGAMEGDPKEAPSPPVFTEGWQLGTPDMIVTLDRSFTLAAGGSDVFRNFVFPVPVDRVRYVRALEIRPGLKKVVHHANLMIDREQSSRRLDGKDGLPGFPGMEVQISSRTFDPDSHFLFWKPGTPVLVEPPDMAWQIDPNTDLVLNVHLQPSGKPETIQPSIGLYFTDKPPAKKPMLLQLEHDGALDIPAGRKDFVVADTLTLPVDVDLLGLYPHAHYVARDLSAFAILPDGSQRPLIHIPEWDINWQAVYRYKKPLFLPRGTVVRMHYVYDNSAANPRNPSHPPVRVRSGDRSVDEMAHLWLQVLPRVNSEGDLRLSLQKAVMERRLQKYPSDFLAEFSLGSVLQTEGKFPEAIRHYRSALTSKPNDATTRNALGSALLALGKSDDAIIEFRKAVKDEPSYTDAHYNLARLLLDQGALEEAISHLREVIRMQPSDGSALTDLGAALIMSGQVESGFKYLRLAVQKQPELYHARYNLGQALALSGLRKEAEVEFREALRLKPNDEDARTALRALSVK